MLELTKEGYIERTRGKGTFVTDSKLIEKIQIVGGVHASLAGKGWSLTVTVIDSAIVSAPPVVVEALALPGSKAWHLRRLAYLENDPAALLTAWLTREFARGVKQLDLGAGSLYQALADVHGVEMSSAENLIEMDRVGAADAELLGLAPGSPVLSVAGITRDQRKRPIEHSKLYLPERFKLAIESVAAPRQPASDAKRGT